jgi:MoxR-like ATPase
MLMQEELHKVIIGQERVVEQLFAAIFTRGHCLLEGVPGLAKTLMVSTVARILDVSFNRIQFTPDLMPSDITGTNVLDDDETGRRQFRFVEGPIFTNILLADEINRTPPKTQAALLQAMQEREVSVGVTTYELPDPFFTIATQNPIEQEGTYPLPEAQLDRFLMHVSVGHPDAIVEKQILHLVRDREQRTPRKVFDPVKQSSIFSARCEVRDVHVSSALEEYLVQIVVATRNPAPYGEDLARWIQWGASPRASLALDRTARARAWLRGRNYASPEDVQAVAPDVLRHRIIPSFEAESESATPDQIVQTLLSSVPLP